MNLVPTIHTLEVIALLVPLVALSILLFIVYARITWYS